MLGPDDEQYTHDSECRGQPASCTAPALCREWDPRRLWCLSPAGKDADDDDDNGMMAVLMPPNIEQTGKLLKIRVRACLFRSPGFGFTPLLPLARMSGEPNCIRVILRACVQCYEAQGLPQMDDGYFGSLLTQYHPEGCLLLKLARLLLIDQVASATRTSRWPLRASISRRRRKR